MWLGSVLVKVSNKGIGGGSKPTGNSFVSMLVEDQREDGRRAVILAPGGTLKRLDGTTKQPNTLNQAHLFTIACADNTRCNTESSNNSTAYWAGSDSYGVSLDWPKIELPISKDTIGTISNT